ncbi:MAG: VOC family protein [Dehalococcoidia bacterium]|jgi:methylmalonyl-CoA/ethylmalonyl-CoA epimerase|nr:VOC family protein [Dehalococcoidia bacterium]
MLERLRQVAMMVNDLEEGRELYQRALGLEVCESHDLPQYGLTNMVMPAGKGTFVELLQPTSADSSGARFLKKRGEAPYLLVFETKEYDRLIPHLKSLGVRITRENQQDGHRSAFVHPASANGAFLEILEVGATDNPWPPAGPDWHKKEWRPRTRQIRQVAVLVRDLEQAIQRWGEMFGLQVTARHQISFTDLEIVVMPLAGQDTFIELAMPKSENAPSARFLEKYGEGIYLVIYQIDDSLAMDDHIRGTGLRYTSSRVTANYTNLGFNSIWLHPATMKGAFTQLSQVLAPENPWPPAGDSWYR